MQSVENYVRAYLLPYDFGLTDEQTAEVLRDAVVGIETQGNGEALDDNQLKHLREIVEEKVQRWRKEYLQAEEARRQALPFVQDFLSQAGPEDLDQLKQRFPGNNPSLSNEIEQLVRVWLSSLPNSRLAACDSPNLRELVFSELRSWC